MTMRRFDPVALAALHRYYMWSLTLKQKFLEEVEQGDWDQDPSTIMASHAAALMSHWYGALYVVVEGYGALGLLDAEIDKLLDSPNVGLLKRYRHGTFHFQPRYLDERFTAFLDEGHQAAEWVQDLSREFGRLLQGRMSGGSS